jgi:hypothetical protein
MLGFAPTTSLAGSGEKLGTGPWISQRRAMDCVGNPSSQEQWACSTLSMTRERLSRMEITHRKRTWTGMGSVRGVLVGFSLAGCISIQIVMTLGYE